MTNTRNRRGWQRLGSALAGCLTLVAGAAVAAPAASAHAGSGHQTLQAGHRGHDHERGRHHGGYLALGDSVAFGYRPPEVTPPADYLDAANFVGYPEYLAARRHLKVTNASCPGETTASMITPGAQSNGCENSVGSPVGYRSTFPLHVAYGGTQLAYAVDQLRSNPHTRLVTINIGANDLFVCQVTTADHCTGSDFPAAVGQVEANLDTILGTLRQQGQYHGRLVVLTYYSLDYTDAQQVGSTQALDAALVRAAGANDARVADGFAAFARASASSGGKPCAAGLLIPLPSGGCNIHPSAKGHRVLAHAIATALEKEHS
ncbi:MAG: SGNH/GDSL hydrolase family protein [Marmoricola sp.]